MTEPPPARTMSRFRKRDYAHALGKVGWLLVRHRGSIQKVAGALDAEEAEARRRARLGGDT